LDSVCRASGALRLRVRPPLSSGGPGSRRVFPPTLTPRDRGVRVAPDTCRGSPGLLDTPLIRLLAGLPEELRLRAGSPRLSIPVGPRRRPGCLARHRQVLRLAVSPPARGAQGSVCGRVCHAPLRPVCLGWHPGWLLRVTPMGLPPVVSPPARGAPEGSPSAGGSATCVHSGVPRWQPWVNAMRDTSGASACSFSTCARSSQGISVCGRVRHLRPLRGASSAAGMDAWCDTNGASASSISTCARSSREISVCRGSATCVHSGATVGNQAASTPDAGRRSNDRHITGTSASSIACCDSRSPRGLRSAVGLAGRLRSRHAANPRSVVLATWLPPSSPDPSLPPRGLRRVRVRVSARRRHRCCSRLPDPRGSRRQVDPIASRAPKGACSQPSLPVAWTGNRDSLPMPQVLADLFGVAAEPPRNTGFPSVFHRGVASPATGVAGLAPSSRAST
jgi:hypothetical protein